MFAARLTTTALLLCGGPALAGPTTWITEPVTPPPPPPPSAADVVDAPLPGAESGIAEGGEGGDSALRVAGRVVLFVPKLAVAAALQPLRLGVWAFDRYQLPDLYYRIFFNDARTVGIVPVLSYDTGYGSTGLTAGARFTHRDLFGEKEHLSLAAAAGMTYRQTYQAELRSGDRFGEYLKLTLDTGYEQRPHDAFYGIGNGSEFSTANGLVDPRTNATSTPAYYSSQRERVSMIADIKTVGPLHLRLSGALSKVDIGAGDMGTSVDEVYDPTMLTGWEGTQYGYGEGQLRWDTRGRTTKYEPSSQYATGSLVAAYVGRQHALDHSFTDFYRYGVDLQHFFRLADGPRVLVVRAHGEAVSGSLADVPFIELPQLGGWTYLRGYPLDRFRDRVAAFASTEYRWDLGNLFQAGLFVDAGRVYDSLDALTVKGTRVGFGFELELHTTDSFVMAASVASSIDGGLQLSLAFNPVFNMQERVRQR